jgi:hypothetical protein
MIVRAAAPAGNACRILAASFFPNPEKRSAPLGAETVTLRVSHEKCKTCQTKFMR